MCNGSAMHLRQTDMHKILPPKKRMPIGIMNSIESTEVTFLTIEFLLFAESYHRFVSNRPDGERIFLMTDNPDGQRSFLENYPPDRVVVYEVIKPPSNATSASELPEEFRFTSLEHIVNDIIIAAHAHTFKGSPFSSASDLVNMYKRSHKLICCESTAAVCL